MKTCQDIFKVNEIVERDIDLLFLEEFVSSSEFHAFFLEKTGYSELQLEKAEVSVVDETKRESDLIACFKDNDIVRVFLIENKINAPMQDKQAEDYRKRGKNYVVEGKAVEYKTVLVAPKGYLKKHESEAKKFDHRISYENILKHLQTSDIPKDRKSYKLSLLQSAIDKQGKNGDWGVKNPSEIVTKFWHDYWELANKIAPEFNMSEPGTKGEESTYIDFPKAEGLPEGAKLRHKIVNLGRASKSDTDYFDIEFGETKPNQLKEHYGHKLQEGKNNRNIHCSTDITKAGASASIRVKLPILDVYRDLEQQRENCITAIQRGRELLKFFNSRQCDVIKEPIHPGEFLTDELEAIKISADELSRRIEVPANRISQIIRGKRDITADTALRLGCFFGTGPELWMNLQKTYDLDKARAVLGSKISKINRWTPKSHAVG